MKLLALSLCLILLLSIVAPVEGAKELKKTTKNKVAKLEQKIDVFLILCKQVGKVGAYKYCANEGMKIYKDRNYKYVSPSYKVILESKLNSWS